jgi:hypothetical protein
MAAADASRAASAPVSVGRTAARTVPVNAAPAVRVCPASVHVTLELAYSSHVWPLFRAIFSFVPVKVPDPDVAVPLIDVNAAPVDTVGVRPV